MHSPYIPIIDTDGTRAVARSSPHDESCLEVLLAGGERVWVPRALAHPLEDGSYSFAQSFHKCVEALTGGEVVLPVLSEELHVQKREVERERVRVSTSVSERAETVDLPLLQQEMTVERVPHGHVVDATTEPYQDGNIWVIPVYEEVLVVEKRIILKEEVRITRSHHERRHREQVTLRREEVTIERLPTDPETRND